MDGARFVRGRNGDPGYNGEGVGGNGVTSFHWFTDMESTAAYGSAATLTGWHFDGFRVRNAKNGIFFNRQQASDIHTNTMDGWYFEDVDGEEIGGHDAKHDSGDGHVIGFQGAANDITMRGSLRCVKTGNPINFYAFTQNDIDPTKISQQGFANLDIDCNPVDIRDHATFSSQSGGGNDVGIHFTGDNDLVGVFTGGTVTLTGTITGFARQIRHKWPDQMTLTSHSQGGLVLEKGNYAGGSDSRGIFAMVIIDVRSVTLSGSSGNWAYGDLLEDPVTPGNVIGFVTRVTGSNPTVTIEFKNTTGVFPYFSNGNTVNNLSDTGTGTANGDAINATLGRMNSNLKYDNIRFESDLDAFYENVGVGTAGGSVTDLKVPGVHLQADNNIYVGTSTGKFITTAHGTQDLTGWQANSAADNIYDPNSSGTLISKTLPATTSGSSTLDNA